MLVRTVMLTLAVVTTTVIASPLSDAMAATSAPKTIGIWKSDFQRGSFSQSRRRRRQQRRRHDRRPMLGIKIGFNMANIGGDDADDVWLVFRDADTLASKVNTGNKVGYSAGVMGTFRINPLIAIQPEVNYTQKGYEISKKDSASTRTQIGSRSYVEVPVLLKLRFRPGRTIDPFVLLGGAFSYLLSSELKWTIHDSYGSPYTGYFDDLFDPLEKTEWSIVFGGGLQVMKAFSIGARYTVGLTTTVKSSTGVEVRNRVLTFMAGVSF